MIINKLTRRASTEELVNALRAKGSEWTEVDNHLDNVCGLPVEVAVSGEAAERADKLFGNGVVNLQMTTQVRAADGGSEPPTMNEAGGYVVDRVYVLGYHGHREMTHMTRLYEGTDVEQAILKANTYEGGDAGLIDAVHAALANVLVREGVVDDADAVVRKITVVID